MSLTALIIINEDDAAFSVLGVPLVEFQVRQAQAVGATHVVLMLNRIPGALLASIDRLRRQGLSIDQARSVTDAIDFVHPEDRVLLIATRVSVAIEDARTLVEGQAQTLLSVPTAPETARFEIIDSHRRWTGWASFEGRFLREVGATIGDWDLAPTILRRLLQGGAAIASAAQPVALLDKADDRHALERRLRDAAEGPPKGLGAAVVSGPVARLAARLVNEGSVRADWMMWGAVIALAGSVGFAGVGFIAISAVVMLIALSGLRTAAILEKASAPLHQPRTVLAWIVAASLIALAILFGVTLTRATGQWGCLVLAMVLAGCIGLLRTPPRRTGNPLLLADAESSLCLIGLSAVAGLALWGLAIAAIHAVVSVALRQRNEASPQA